MAWIVLLLLFIVLPIPTIIIGIILLIIKVFKSL